MRRKSVYRKAIHNEYERAKTIPLQKIEHAGSEIFLLRTDLLEAGIKSAIGTCLAVHYIESNNINANTKALVVHGSGNTVTAVQLAVQETGTNVGIVAVVYAETSPQVVERLRKKGIEVVPLAPRSSGRENRQQTAEQYCTERSGYVLLEQHEQPLIIAIQRDTFGRRIASEIPDATHLVAGVGTGGTLFGIGAALRRTNPHLHVTAVEGVGSTLTLWHTYLKVAEQNFAHQEQALRHALSRYEGASMVTSISSNPDAPHDEWFEIDIDFPEHVTGTVGIEGLGVGHPTELIMSKLPTLNDVHIVTDRAAQEGTAALAAYDIRAVESAGANFFAAMQLAEHLRTRGLKGRIVTVVTASSDPR